MCPSQNSMRHLYYIYGAYIMEYNPYVWTRHTQPRVFCYLSSGTTAKYTKSSLVRFSI